MFKEALEMNFSGSVYHPKLMEFDFLVEFSPEQQREKSEPDAGDDEFRNSYLNAYRFSSTFLKEKPVVLSFFSDKKEEISNRDFFERQVIDSMNYGGGATLAKHIMPLSFSFNHTDRDIDRSFRADLETEEETYNLNASPRLAPLGEIRMDFTHEKFERIETGISEQAGITDNISLFNSKEFGEEENKNLTSAWRYYSLDDTRDSKRLSLDELFTFDHSDKLRSLYGYNYFDTSSENINTVTQEVNFGLRHQLYESLDSSFDLERSSTDSTGLDEETFNLGLSENYKKNIGDILLRLGFDFNYEDRERSSLMSFLNTIDEAHVLDDSSVVLLNETRIDLSTVVVTNATGTITYTREVDYQLIEQSGGGVEIRRIVGGSITNGQQILVDYVTLQNPSFEFVKFQNAYRMSVGLWDEKLRFYSNLKRQRFQDFEGERNLILEKYDDRIAGFEIKSSWADFSVEYEDYESDLIPLNALRMNGGIRHALSPLSDFSLRLRRDRINLPEDERNNMDVRGIYSRSLSRFALWRMEVGQRWQRSQSVDLKDFSSRTSFQIRRGNLFFEMGYEFEEELSEQDKLENHLIFSKIKRNF